MARHWTPREVVQCVEPACGWWGIRVASSRRKPCPRCNSDQRVKVLTKDQETEAQRSAREARR